MKYIRHSELGFILWAAGRGKPSHAEMATKFPGPILSAGFVLTVGGEPPVCFGDSGSLMLASRPDDTEALRQHLEEI